MLQYNQFFDMKLFNYKTKVHLTEKVKFLIFYYCLNMGSFSYQGLT